LTSLNQVSISSMTALGKILSSTRAPFGSHRADRPGNPKNISRTLRENALETLEKLYIDVAVALPVRGVFTYEVPAALREDVEVGKRVLVPFKHLQVTAYILDSAHSTEQKGIKQILSVLDEIPMFPASMVPFFNWISNYYDHPIGGVIQGALPGGLNVKQVEMVNITDKGRACPPARSLSPGDGVVLEFLKERGPILVTALHRELGEQISPRLLQSLEGTGWITRERELKAGRVRPKLERHVGPVADRPPAEGLSKVRQQILRAVEGRGEISMKSLREQIPSASRLAGKMAEDGFLAIVERPVYRDPFGEPISPAPHGPVLTKAQGSVVDRLVDNLDSGFQTYLLDGITGSGKTEVYMQAVAATLEKGREALVLVPEIALISQMERVFRARFGECVSLLHSGLSEGERFDQWMRIIRKEARVAIGARSAVFAPFQELGLIVVDEEHDDSYKQGAKLRYHARDLAVVRAKLQGCLALLGSATPSVSSSYNVHTGKFRGLSLSKRIDDRALPEVTVVDLRERQGSRRAKPFITRELREAIAETLDRGEQTLLFLNRRGFANSPACVHCGAPVLCTNCDITMTLHQGADAFKCHYCGHIRARASGCPTCGSSKIKMLGLGTEKVEDKIKALFPQARVARMDRDTTNRKGALIRILKDLKAGDIDVLVGTQMVAKGHDYPNITLVGIICADLSLNFPDFRAGERTFQLLAQVAGRAGRGQRPGRVILQTFNPDHFCILTARDQDYKAFYDREIGFRKALGYPPFSRLVRILVTGRDKEQTARSAKLLGEICRAVQAGKKTYRKDVDIMGPVAAPLSRLKRQFRWLLLLKGRRLSSLRGLTREVVNRAAGRIPKKDVKIIVDIDPVDML
jgi:primosomal protein N' (replication factor Y)